MICEMCHIERDSKAFLGGVLCYKCIYRLKTKGVNKKKKKMEMCCKVCEKMIPITDDIPQRQKKLYCSDECAYSAHRSQIANWWVKSLRKRIPLTHC